MKIVAAYLLSVLGGNTSPSADDLKNILGSGFFILFHLREFLLFIKRGCMLFRTSLYAGNLFALLFCHKTHTNHDDFLA